VPAVRVTLVLGAGHGADACSRESVALRGGACRNADQGNTGRQDESDETPHFDQVLALRPLMAAIANAA